MFATTDLDSARQIYLTALLADGSEQEIHLEQPYRDTLDRARGLPSGVWLDRLAEAVFQALEATPEIQFPVAPQALRVEVWRLSYQADTLAPTAAPVAGATYPFPDNGH